MTSRTRLATALVAAALALSACSSGGSDRSGPSTSAGQQATSTTEASAGSGSGAPTDSTAKDGGGGDTAEVSSVGTFGVGMASFDFDDPSRQTPANGSAPAHPGRHLVGLVWYPSTGKAPGGDKVPEATEGVAAHAGRFPLVIFSHGVTGKATFYNQILRAWASAGYVVVAPDYPLSNLDAPGGPTVSDVGQQPGDASFVLDQFLGDAKPAKELPAPLAKVADHIDGDHIAAVGHSLGAITSLGLGYATCCTDDRIDAVAEFAGIVLPLQQKPSPDPKVTDRPLLIIHGDRDGTVGYANGQAAFKDVEVPRWFITLPGGGHIPPYLAGRSGPQATLVVDATLDFLDAELKGDPDGIDRMEALVTEAGPKVATIESAG